MAGEFRPRIFTRTLNTRAREMRQHFPDAEYWIVTEINTTGTVSLARPGWPPGQQITLVPVVGGLAASLTTGQRIICEFEEGDRDRPFVRVPAFGMQSPYTPDFVGDTKWRRAHVRLDCRQLSESTNEFMDLSTL